MRARAAELAERVTRRGYPAEVNVRIGINSGYCTVGVFGSDLMRAYKAVGFAVNLASRLQGHAEPGSILCGVRTYALVEGRGAGGAARAAHREGVRASGRSLADHRARRSARCSPLEA